MLLGATDFFTVVAAGVFSGVMEGVTVFPPARRTEYGSAVAGRVNSGRGRIGRRTVPLIKEPVPLGFDATADFVRESADKADGGRAVVDDAVDALETVLEPRDIADCDFTGE